MTSESYLMFCLVLFFYISMLFILSPSLRRAFYFAFKKLLKHKPMTRQHEQLHLESKKWVWWKSRIVIAGAILTAALFIVPPWHFWINTATMRRSEPAPRSLIFDPPLPMKFVKYSNAERWEVDQSRSVGVDFGRLLIEYTGIMILTGIALLIRSRTVK